jgi:hypothetical protein
METDHSIPRRAQQLRAEYGADAVRVAEERASHLSKTHHHEGAELWRCVATVIIDIDAGREPAAS